MPATNALLQEGRYRISNEIPDEETGSVYDAYDTVSETNVVVREIPVKLNKVETTSQRESRNIAFADRAKILTEINHESILHVRDYFSEIGRQYLVMESVEGDDLQTLLDRQKSCFPVSDVAGWADQLLDGLNYLHTYRTSIVHRNVRPENIKLDSEGKITLMSFGLIDDGEVQVHGDQASGGEGAGIAYNPLEQIWNGLDAASQKVIISKYDERSERILKEDLDARSDIYSLGATLYHLVTARVPVDALERSIEILEGRPDPLRSPNKIDPNIPPEVSDVIIKAMEIKREYRFDSAAIMRQVLRTALVRVKEREDEETREQEEAANDIKLAEQKKLQNKVPQELSETEHIKQQLQEAEAKRLLAEQRAAEAEKRLRESEAAHQAKPELAAPIVDLDDDLLGLLSPALHISEAPKVKTADKVFPTGAVDKKEAIVVTAPEQELTSEEKIGIQAEEKLVNVETEELTASEQIFPAEELSEPATQDFGFSATEPVEEEVVESWNDDAAFSESVPVEEESVEPENEEISLAEDETVDQAHVDEVVEQLLASSSETDDVQAERIEEVIEEVVEKAPAEQNATEPMPEAKVAATPAVKKAFDEVYSEPVERSGLPLPAMAIGAVVLIMIAVGLWMFMFAGTSPKTSFTETPSTGQPATADSAVKSASQSADVPASVQSDPAAKAITSDPAAVKAVTAATPKPKKPTQTPAKAPAQKKAVTVDDLINDN